jgi:hypothetical protein
MPYSIISTLIGRNASIPNGRINYKDNISNQNGVTNEVRTSAYDGNGISTHIYGDWMKIESTVSY